MESLRGRYTSVSSATMVFSEGLEDLNNSMERVRRSLFESFSNVIVNQIPFEDKGYLQDENCFKLSMTTTAQNYLYID